MLKKNNIILIFILLFLVFLWLASAILLPFAVGILLAYILNPLVIKMESIGLGHLISVLIALLISLLLFFGGFIFLIPVCIEQFGIILSKFPLIYEQLLIFIDSKFNNILNNNDYLDSFKRILSSKSDELISILINIFSVSLGKGMALLNILGLIIITPIVTCYILYDWQKIIKYLRDSIPKNYKKTIESKLPKIDTVLSSFFRGQFIVSIILMTFYASLLSILGLEGAISIGFIIGVLSFIPYLGSVIGLSLTLLFSLLQFSSLTIILYVLGIFIIGQLIESYILVPKYISKNVGIHPLIGMFVLLGGGAAFGILGVLIAIPLTAVLCAVLRDQKT
ncbi:AI-2E family transporter [Alphaproteobacteria bacterium]|nr:AI-2E family transporter [Alphaproteobacteria bacterium]